MYVCVFGFHDYYVWFSSVPHKTKIQKSKIQIGCMSVILFGSKDEQGYPDCRGFLDQTVQPNKKSGHGVVFCFIRGMVRSGIQETGWIGNGVVFFRCGYFVMVRG